MEGPQAKTSPEVENWDDGDFDDFNEIQFRTASTATSVVSHPQGNHRESVSSRMSMRSDSNQGDEHWDVVVDEQSSIKDALTIAKSKGIPLPTNVPRSALEGGTIRRLGGKAIKKAIADDWSEDLDFASAPTQLKLAKPEDRDLSDSLRQISAAFKSSPKSPDSSEALELSKSPKSRLAPTPVSLDRFRDAEDDDDFGDIPTIRVAKHRSPQKITTTPNQFTRKPDTEDLELDFELPADGKLRLSTKRLTPKTPLQGDDFDIEWAEGSLGTRHAGTKRGGFSNRSSSVSALSPSVSSAFTGESEEDGLDGLLLPAGPVDFSQILKKRQDLEKGKQPPPIMSRPQAKVKPNHGQEDEDFADGLVLPQGKVFEDNKMTMNRNVKVKTTRPSSPGKMKATTLSFTTNKTPVSQPSRYQRQDRPRSWLEPVSESGQPIQRYQRPGSRLGHTAQSSVSSIPTPSTPTPGTPSRRDLRNVNSRSDLRYQPNPASHAQMLRAKTSMPSMAGISSPTRISFNRPSSRQDGTSSRLRPRSPDRPESRVGLEKRGSIPFLPAGASASQSAHVSTRPTVNRYGRRPESDGSGESMTAAQRSLSRLAGIRPETPNKNRGAGFSTAELAAQAKKTMNKPLRRQQWGNGSELELFDDLPTSAQAEAKFTKLPIGRGKPRLLNKLGQNPFAASNTSLISVRSGAETPQPLTPSSPTKAEQFAAPVTTNINVPRFARDTAASRNAREQRTISTTFHNMRGEPLQPISANWKPTLSYKPSGSLRSKKRDVQKKPHLIKPMGGDMNREKDEKGMHYDPVLCKWEGNENALAPFDVPDFEPRHPSPVSATGRARAGSNSPSGKAAPALIMNVGNSSGVQLVNGMVFDPRQMRWLKVAAGERGDRLRGGSGSVQLEEEEDVFAGLEDLKEEDETASRWDKSQAHSTSGQQDLQLQGAAADAADVNNDESGHLSGSGEEWGVAEEFDVGPEFVRRQRGEEDRWKRKVEKWLRSDEEIQAEEIEGVGDWRWAIRDMVVNHIGDPGLPLA